MNESKPQTNKKLNTGMAIIAYLLFFVPLLTDDKKDPFVKFHVKQSIMILFLMIASNVVMIIPILGWIAGPIGCLIGFVLFIMGIINAANGTKKELPIIGKYAEQILKF